MYTLGRFRKDLSGSNSQVFSNAASKQKLREQPLSAKEGWEFLFSSGSVIKQKAIFGGKPPLKGPLQWARL
jgi:hypothetical protein